MMMIPRIMIRSWWYIVVIIVVVVIGDCFTTTTTTTFVMTAHEAMVMATRPSSINTAVAAAVPPTVVNNHRHVHLFDDLIVNDGECVLDTTTTTTTYPTPEYRYQDHPYYDYYYFNVTHHIQWKLENESNRRYELHPPSQLLLNITITPFHSTNVIRNVITTQTVTGDTKTTTTTTTTSNMRNDLLTTDTPSPPFVTTTTVTRYNIIQQPSLSVSNLHHHHHHNRTLLDDLWNKSIAIPTSTTTTVPKWCSFFFVWTIHNDPPSSVDTETIHVHSPSTFHIVDHDTKDDSPPKKHLSFWNRPRSRTETNPIVPQSQFHRYHPFHVTWFPWSDFFQKQRNLPYNNYHYTWHSTYIPEQNFIFYNVTRSNNDNPPVVVLYGSSFYYYNNTNRNSSIDDLSSATELLIHTFDIIWDELIPSTTWMLSFRMVRSCLRFMIQYWLQQNVFPNIFSSSQKLSSFKVTRSSRPRTTLVDMTPILIQIPIDTAARMTNHSTPSRRMNQSRINEHDGSDSNTTTSTTETTTTSTSERQRHKNILESIQIWFNDITTRPWNKPIVLFGMIHVGRDRPADQTFRDTLPPEPPIASRRHFITDVTTRPIGLTRYLLVCCIIMLSLYNIHLYFSQ